MYTPTENTGLPSMPLARMLSSILPFLAVATPAMLLAGDVSNTASVTAPAGTIDLNQEDNSATLVTDVLAEIVATPDNVTGVNGRSGAAAVINVFAGDTLDGSPATPADATVALAPGAALPPGITFDLATGDVGVEPGTAAGTYTFDYQICEISAPDNCEIATVTIEVVEALAELSGTVFLDVDGDREIDANEPLLDGWIVEVLNGDTLIASTVSAEDGSYSFPGLLGGNGYTIRFREPETGVVFEQIADVWLEDNTTLPDQNLPIDPSGIVYDSIARTPVPGAVVSLLDRNGNLIPEDCLIDPSQFNQVTGSTGAYRFDVVPGADPACPTSETEYNIQVTPPAGFSFTSTVLAPQPGALDPTGLGSPVLVSPSANIPVGNDPAYFLSFELESGDPDVINNHIPLDPFLSRDGLIVTKTSPRRSASTGDLIPYEITVRNEEAFRRAGVDVVDVLPPGLTFVEGSARVNGAFVEPQFESGNRELVWADQTIPANGSVTYELVLIVGAGVTEGQAVNTAVSENALTGEEISNRGSATISIVPSTIFDCSELIGQVFEDYNRNGYQDEGEHGIPSVRLATVNGQLITTDEYGRYHITCAAVPDPRIGSNFVLRLDEETLPQGWAVTTDNPRSIRLTRGKLGELNFGVAQAEIVALTFDQSSFTADGSLRAGMLDQLQALSSEEETKFIVRASYAIDGGENEAQIANRLSVIRDTVRAFFANDWDGLEPVIQIDAVNTQNAEGGQ